MTGLADVLAALDIAPVENGFRAQNLDAGWGVVFGGQILAQTIVAASRAAPGMEVASLHTVFARAAKPDLPLDMGVEVLNAGRSFTSLTVTVSQEGKPRSRSVALLHVPDPHLVRFDAVPPVVDPPDDMPDRGHEGWWDVRYGGDVDITSAAIGPPTLDVWCRVPGAPGDPLIGQALLGYASDGFLIAAAMRPHEGLGQDVAHQAVDTTVLTHTLSFHAPVDASQWFLLAQRSPVAGRGRSYGTADVFTGEGRLVASFAQVNMIRGIPASAR